MKGLTPKLFAIYFLSFFSIFMCESFSTSMYLDKEFIGYGA